jgi:hypothetical protein
MTDNNQNTGCLLTGVVQFNLVKVVKIERISWLCDAAYDFLNFKEMEDEIKTE